MKILYVHPGMNINSTQFAIMPMGIIGLMNQLGKMGFIVRGINLPLELSISNSFDLVNEIANWCPDIVLIDLHWYVHSAGAIQVAKLVRQTKNDTLIIIGGLTASIFHQEVLKFCPDINIIIRGYAEETVSEIAKEYSNVNPNWNKIAGISWLTPAMTIESSGISNNCDIQFDSLDFVKLTWLDHYNEYYKSTLCGFDTEVQKRYWLEVGRGCSRQCSMCGGGCCVQKKHMNLRKMKFRSPQRIVADLKQLEKLGVDQVALSHDIFSDHPQAELLLEKLEKASLSIGLYYEYMKLPVLETIQKVYNAFNPKISEAAISFESGNERIRNLNFPGKIFSNDDFLNLMQDITKYCGKIKVFVATNLPWESQETWQDTLNLMEAIFDSCDAKRLSAAACYLTIDPYSPMWNNPDYYEITRIFSSFKDYYNMCKIGQRTPGYESKYLSIGGVASNIEAFSKKMCELLSPNTKSKCVVDNKAENRS